MPIPKPNPGEKEGDYIERCMRAQSGENISQDQKLGICYSTLREARKNAFMQTVGKWITKQFKSLALLLTKDKIQKGIMFDGYESPEPGDISEHEKVILSHTYAACRKDGGDKEKCSKIAWAAVNAYRNKSK